ncbi:DUF370 domain-containing protein [Natribacillus halophilus]|uniref:Putative regulatory protein SAMN04488123_101115 n=1 Tax=Natribacillus halophilus TaxID=549003 RepID=A0A1G8JA96_9BACI|nr:DUF370 domain-containing protein [Natribacillus halophilus]SDI27907.1 hypothetical protein SAMN04488123_101115 [Natribacillus halophilus]
MKPKPLNIGFGNIVPSNRIVSIVQADSAPTKRMIQEARERQMLVDATNGRKTRSIILVDSDHIILSAIHPDTVAQRLDSKDKD